MTNTWDVNLLTNKLQFCSFIPICATFCVLMMESNLQHEDLLMKLRAKLNEGKIKLWEPPYFQPGDDVSDSIKELATKYATELSSDQPTILSALHELQLHSLERSKANAEFKETGCATFRVRARMVGEKPRVLVVRRKMDVMGSELIAAVAEDFKVVEARVKLIFNGKVIKPTSTLDQQGLKNGAQLMALIMAETPEEARQEDTMYMEMKQTRDDAVLLSECVDELADDDEYMKLEDQSGNAIELPREEKKALLVGLALHERGREHIKKKEYALALVLLLEADRQFCECRSSILQSVDNYAVLQVDISWCYLCLQAIRGASDAARRLASAKDAFALSYGEHGERLRALKGDDSNERVLLMRLCLLQGIVAYHQNRRDEAKRLLDKAEMEINVLRVDQDAVAALMELGWSASAARSGLRVKGDVTEAHHYLVDKRETRRAARDQHKDQRRQRFLGVCLDGTPVKEQLVTALVGMGFSERIATLALRNSNNHVADAVRIIQEQPELLAGDSDLSSDDNETPSSEESNTEPDNKLVAELEAMGYAEEEARLALNKSRNNITGAVDILLECGGCLSDPGQSQANPSTSSGAVKRKHKEHKQDQKRRREALQRLKKQIKSDQDDYLDTSLVEEEEYLVQYKSLL